jgi:hypothetical protein
MKSVKLFLFTLALTFTLNAAAQTETAIPGQAQQRQISGISGKFRCTFNALVDENSERQKLMNSTEVTKISLNGTSGVITHPTGMKDFVSFGRTNSGPKATGHIYTFNNSEVFESILMSISNNSSGKKKSALLLFLKPVANTKYTALGFCDY